MISDIGSAFERHYLQRLDPSVVHDLHGDAAAITGLERHGDAPPPPKPTTQIEVLPDRAHLEIRWPNVLRVETLVRPQLVIDWSKVPALVLDPSSTPISAELAPALGGATDLGKVTAIDLEKLPDGFRLQRLVLKKRARRSPRCATALQAPPTILPRSWSGS